MMLSYCLILLLKFGIEYIVHGDRVVFIEAARRDIES